MTVAADHETLLCLRVPARAERLKEVRCAVGEAAARCGPGADWVRDVVMAVDEACQNVIRHAYGEGTDGEVIVEIRRRGEAIVIELRDFADPVEAKKIKPRDLDDLRPGGLGTHFMREVMESVEYLVPAQGRGNLLRMVKRIS
jgi:sigma-B regulation protein RsbU (phosphoserine phosphatase)